MALNFPFKKSSSDLSDSHDKPRSDIEFYEAINLFKTQRLKIGISLETLSKETKISRNVLIAIENGWKKYLPEKTYLISMIKSLELKLNLEKGSLNGLSIQKDSINNDVSRFKLNFINIDFLNSWIGSLLYFIIMLLSILALNSQQKYLIKINSISTEPIKMEKTFIEDGKVINKAKEN
ncbi:helix-turn-helix domain-containing protein [Prochlorococcus marinus]|uniref:helix-turn-helix domain-containing protein n=1 Tax=Prochlorococcus marinus TaxID=1219 RepID=UPI0022B5D2F5|nr:helix-turn-helix domain-containing protein [Prochlorococcus marinus]